MGKDAQILSKLIKRAKKRDDDPLGPLIDAYMMKRQDAPLDRRLKEFVVPMVDRARPPGRLSPSTIGGCKKQAVFKFLGVEGRRKIDPDRQMLFDDGNWRHHRLGAMMLDMERVLGPKLVKVIEIEERVHHEPLYISGSLDITAALRQQKWVIDFKGINSYGFDHVMLNNEPRNEHILQLTTYMRARRIPRGLLWYENKNDQRSLRYVIKYEHGNWEEIEQWCQSVLKYLDRKELPSMHPECIQGNFLYDQCVFAEWCYGNLSVEQQREKAYKNFDGLDEAWEEGIRAE